MSPSTSYNSCEHILSKDGYCTKCGATANEQVILYFI